MPEMFQQSQKVRQTHAAKVICLLFEMSVCGACIEHQMIAMKIEEDLATVCANVRDPECCGR
jgi:hypothetical protein